MPASRARRALRTVAEAADGLQLLLVRHYPGAFGLRLRRWYYGRRLGALGPGTRIDEGVSIVGAEHIFIGRNCHIQANASLRAGPNSTAGRHVIARPNEEYHHGEGEIHVGDYSQIGQQVTVIAHGGVAIEHNVAVAAGCRIYSSTQHYTDGSGEPGVVKYGSGRRTGEERQQAILVGPVVVKDNCLVGANAVVMPGTTMGPRTWLGAGGFGSGRLEPGRVYGARNATSSESASAAADAS